MSLKTNDILYYVWEISVLYTCEAFCNAGISFFFLVQWKLCVTEIKTIVNY